MWTWCLNLSLGLRSAWPTLGRTMYIQYQNYHLWRLQGIYWWWDGWNLDRSILLGVGFHSLDKKSQVLKPILNTFEVISNFQEFWPLQSSEFIFSGLGCSYHTLISPESARKMSSVRGQTVPAFLIVWPLKEFHSQEKWILRFSGFVQNFLFPSLYIDCSGCVAPVTHTLLFFILLFLFVSCFSRPQFRLRLC